jgi:hypothetical protein
VDFDLAVLDGPWPGRSAAVRLGVNEKGSWVLVGEAAKFKNVSSFTVEVKSMQNLFTAICYVRQLTTHMNTDVVLSRTTTNSIQKLPLILRARECLLAT